MSADLQSKAFPPLRTVLPTGNGAGMRWLVERAVDPVECRTAWMTGRLAEITLRGFAVLRVAPALGLRLLDERLPKRPAPVLYSRDDSSLQFLVGPPKATSLDLPDRSGGTGMVDLGLTLHPVTVDQFDSAGTAVSALDQLAGLIEMIVTGVLMCPAPGRELPLRRTRWVVEPDGTGLVWDAAAVVEALAEDQQWLWSLKDPIPANSEQAPDGDTAARFVMASRALRAAS
ncbi:hypothetical protein ACIQF6_28300 [Kitasatospora sp. NPDC092948]|uniref:hypothetical protein n=1 Tax=Kitasatospora sp. NPDC092948 TaxID=3364088 RepID=UPI0038041FE3